MDTNSIVRRLRSFARSSGLTKGQFARRAGLHDTVLRGFDTSSWNPTLATLAKLEAIVPEGWCVEHTPVRADVAQAPPAATEPSIQSQAGA